MKHNRTIFKSALSSALVCSLLAVSACNKEESFMYSNANIPKIASAVYPETVKYPGDDDCFDDNGEISQSYVQWSEQQDYRHKAKNALEEYQKGLWNFYGETINTFLADSGENNRVYSPVNLYFALAMAAEITDGESRSQILELLGADSIDLLRQQTDNLWTAAYRDDGAVATVLANSFWLNDSVSFKKPVTDLLAERYYADGFQGDPASKDMNEALRAWLNEKTDGLLEDAVEGVELSPETVIALCSTVYFRAKWDLVFSKNDNDHRTFHSPGGDVEREFMNKTFMYGPYYYGEDFAAIRINFAEGGGMWIILPDEDKSVKEVIGSGEYLEMIANPYGWVNSASVRVNCSIPKFDAASDIDLVDGLKKLSVTDVFDIEKSDFTPLTEDTGVYFTDVKHAARVTIDEEGCTAAAYTAMLADGAAMPPEDEVDFVVDRPFVFAVMGDCEQPLFVGTVYDL